MKSVAQFDITTYSRYQDRNATVHGTTNARYLRAAPEVVGGVQLLVDRVARSSWACPTGARSG